MHLAVDATSHEIRAVEMTDHRHGDGEILTGLLAQVPQGEQTASVNGYGAYDTHSVYEASATHERHSSCRPDARANHGRRGPQARASATKP